MREGCEENPTGAIASCLGEGGRQKTVVCKYTKWPASSVPAGSGRRKERAWRWETNALQRQPGPSEVGKGGERLEGSNVRIGKGAQNSRRPERNEGKLDQRETEGSRVQPEKVGALFPSCLSWVSGAQRRF